MGLTTLPPSMSRLSRLDNARSLTFHNPIGLHGLLRGLFFAFFLFANKTAPVVQSSESLATDPEDRVWFLALIDFLSIVADYGLHDRSVGVRVPTESRMFPFTIPSRLGMEPSHPLINRVTGTISSGVNRPEGEDEHSLPTKFQDKKIEIHTSTSSYNFMQYNA
jgi:hypothetical protein